METGSKIEDRKKELKIRRFFSLFRDKVPREPLLQTILIFLFMFLLINYYFVKPKLSAAKNFLVLMNKGNMNEISEMASNCSLYKNEKLNEALKKEYLSELSYIIQTNKLTNISKFYIRLTDSASFSLDLNVSPSNYGSLTKDLKFIYDKGTYKLDTNSYIKTVCYGDAANKTQLENKILMRQLLYCYQYYLDDFINNKNTTVFSFISKNSSLYKYLSKFKKNNLNLSQATASIEFKDTKLTKNSAVINAYETIRQDKNKIISLKKQNLSYKAVYLNGHWLLADNGL